MNYTKDMLYIKWTPSRRENDPSIEISDGKGNVMVGGTFKWAPNFYFVGDSYSNSDEFLNIFKSVFEEHNNGEHWDFEFCKEWNMWRIRIIAFPMDVLLNNPNVKFVNPRPRNWGKG